MQARVAPVGICLRDVPKVRKDAIRGVEMTKFRDVFTNKHVILPVIHVTDAEQALRNADIARKAGADGVFLINHEISHGTLLEIHKSISDEHWSWWVGVNCLGFVPSRLFKHVKNVSGVWVDNAFIAEDQFQQPLADEIRSAQEEARWEGLYFGGVAFKYQRSVEDLESAVKIASHYMDVITTSGPGTGQKASVRKIERMKAAVPDCTLAIASGITPDNVADYLMADVFMVATGVSRDFENLDPDLLGALVERVRNHRT